MAIIVKIKDAVQHGILVEVGMSKSARPNASGNLLIVRVEKA
jgi:hypothetical protein